MFGLLAIALRTQVYIYLLVGD